MQRKLTKSLSKTRKTSQLDVNGPNLSAIMGLENPDDTNNNADNEHSSLVAASRAAATYFDKYDRDDLQEALTSTSLDWLLSVDETKIQVDPPVGLVSNLKKVHDLDDVIVLIPAPKDVTKPLELRELHQILRELVTGIYIFNQVPSLSLETNFDRSSSCQMPVCYHDTRVGQLMISVDYMMKSIWHGAILPADKRSKFNERWKQAVNLNSLTGEPETRRSHQHIWKDAGLVDLATDEDFQEAFSKLNESVTADKKFFDEQKFFMKYVDDLAMVLTFRQESIKYFRNLFVVDSCGEISTKIRNQNIDMKSFERLQRQFHVQEQFIKINIENKEQIRRDMTLLKLVSLLIPILIGLKRKNKVPDVSKFLPTLTHEECKTDRELPPIVISENLFCKNFEGSDHYVGLHGGINFLRETPNDLFQPSLGIRQGFGTILQANENNANKLNRTGPLLDSYPLTPIEIDNEKYFIFSFDIETYYPVTPKIPKLIHAHYDEIAKLKPKKLPLSEIQIHEQFRKRYGYQKTVKLKQVPAGLKASAQRGMTAVFNTICRRQTITTLGSLDQQGMSLLHDAAAMNRPQIITQLVTMGLDVNVRRYNNASELGIMPIHLAARCGAEESIAALVAFKADLMAYDANGFTALHYAAYFNNVNCLRTLIHKDASLLELKTKFSTSSTPLLLASSSGAIEALQLLITLDADLNAKDSNGDSVVNIAVLHEHTHILEYFITEGFSEAPVWNVLVSMLNDESLFYQQQAAKCLEALTLKTKENWHCIVKADGIQALVSLLDTDDVPLLSLVVSVLCNIGEFSEVRQKVSSENAVPQLIGLLSCNVPLVHSRVAVILGDLGCLEENQARIAAEGGIEKLVLLLSSNVEHVLVNVVNALRILCEKDPENQKVIGDSNAIPTIIELIGSTSIRLQANVAAFVSALAQSNRPNQDHFIREGAVRPLVKLLRSKDSRCQLKAARALQTLSENNQYAQEEIDKCDAGKPLIRLLKLWDVNMKEQGATALWALAGENIENQKRIAELIGINILVDMLMTKSEKLQFVAGMALTALGKEDIANQNRISEEGGIMPLVRILRGIHLSSSEQVLIMAIQVLGSLCLGVAHQPNKALQKEIASTDALDLLINFMLNPKNLLIKVEAANTLAKIVLSNPLTQEELAKHKSFDIAHVLNLLRIKDIGIRLKAANALATFAYNSIDQQLRIRSCGGVMMKSIEIFVDSENEMYQAYGAFQIIVLARVIVDVDQVTLSARGVKILVDLLSSKDNETKVLSASLLASLAHTRAGIPDAMIVVGAVENLVENLHSQNGQVRGKAAVALGYLTFNSTASRMLLSACRNTPGLYDSLSSNLGNGKLSMAFVEEWQRNVNVGLPCNSLVINGGPPVPIKQVSPRRQRPRTSHSLPALRNPSRERTLERYTSVEQRPKTAGTQLHFPKSVSLPTCVQRSHTVPINGKKSL